MLKVWSKGKRAYKTIILGGRAGTSLLHKSLLITGMINWGLWSLHTRESEAQIKIHVWSEYPNVKEKWLKQKYYWELAKAPEFGYILDKLMKIYPRIKFIIMERDLEERITSHIGAWGERIKKIWEGFPNWRKTIEDEFGYYPDDIRDLLRFYMIMRNNKQEKELENYNQSLILRIQFNDLMNDFDSTMKKICEFIDIPYNTYKQLFREMRNIKHMDTGSDINKWIKT